MLEKFNNKEDEGMILDLIFFVVLLFFTMVFARQYFIVPLVFSPPIIDAGRIRLLLGGITLLGGAMSIISGWSVYRKIKN